jgi:transcriptional regulator with XRE-family HTH domain
MKKRFFKEHIMSEKQDNEIMCELLLYLEKRYGLLQKNVAAKVGTGESTLSDIKSGEKIFSRKLKLNFERAFRINKKYLDGEVDITQVHELPDKLYLQFKEFFSEIAVHNYDEVVNLEYLMYPKGNPENINIDDFWVLLVDERLYSLWIKNQKAEQQKLEHERKMQEKADELYPNNKKMFDDYCKRRTAEINVEYLQMLELANSEYAIGEAGEYIECFLLNTLTHKKLIERDFEIYCEKIATEGFIKSHFKNEFKDFLKCHFERDMDIEELEELKKLIEDSISKKKGVDKENFQPQPLNIKIKPPHNNKTRPPTS